MQIAICPGSFDPITNGHIDVIERAASIFDKVIIGIAENVTKKPSLGLSDRIELVKNACAHLENVAVESFDCLLVEFAKRNQANIIVRGLRAVSDFEHEFQMAQLNHKLDPSIETMFIMASPKYAYLSSSAVREIAKYGGCLTSMVPENVEIALKKAFSQIKY